MSHLIFLSFFLTLNSLFLTLNSPSAHAQNPSKGFTISPPFQDILVSKDQTSQSFYVDIKNNGLLTQTLNLSIVDFGTLDESGGVAFLGSNPTKWQLKYGLASWVSLEKDTLIIASQSSQRVKITIDNKDSLSPGGHYAGLMATLIHDSRNDGSEVGIDQVFTSLIFVKKLGGEVYDLDLNHQDFENIYPFHIPDTVRLRFQNKGNIHIVPRGIIEIKDPLGRIISSSPINPESSIIIPESFRLFPTTLESTSPAIFPGRYMVKISYRFDGKNDYVSSLSSFFYLGLSFIVFSFAISTGLCVAIILFIRFKLIRKKYTV